MKSGGFSYYTIIGKDPWLFRYHVKNTLDNAGLERDRWDFHTIIYFNDSIPQDTTDELVSICESNDIKVCMQPEDPAQPFINRLYACWNLGYSLGKRPLVFRGGSDQTWNKGAFRNILEAYESLPGEAILQAQTVESPISGGCSRHFIGDFGTTYEDYNDEAFQSFCADIAKAGVFSIDECLEIWGKPTSFNSSLGANHNRTDGCSWLQSRELFFKYGPMPALLGGITGDVIIHDRYQRAGIPNYLVGNCITYHMVRGESR